VTVAGKWNPAHHPRDKRGRFTKSATRVMTPGEKKKATALAGSFKGSDQGPGPGSGAAKRPLTGDQSSALDGYLGGGFKDTNRNLRAGNGAADPAVEHLDAAMQELPADVTVTRRVSLGMFGGVPIDQLAGTKVRDAGYTSASLTELPGDGPAVHMRIQVPAGTKGIPVPGSPSGEIILDRDVEFAVLGASKRDDGGYDMTMIALPKKPLRPGKTSEANEGVSALQGDEALGKIPVTSDRAVSDYALIGNSINRELRTKGEFRNPQIVQDIDAMFERAPALTHAVEMHRGTGEANKIFGPVGSMVGKTFVDNGYTSAATTKAVVDGFGAVETHVRITAPAGSKVLHLQGHPGLVPSETMLPRGTSYLIRSDAVSSGGVREVHLDVTS
jgi:ADP-ribosyltransferase exoenzyme